MALHGFENFYETTQENQEIFFECNSDDTDDHDLVDDDPSEEEDQELRNMEIEFYESFMLRRRIYLDLGYSMETIKDKKSALPDINGVKAAIVLKFGSKFNAASCFTKQEKLGQNMHENYTLNFTTSRNSNISIALNSLELKYDDKQKLPLKAHCQKFAIIEKQENKQIQSSGNSIGHHLINNQLSGNSNVHSNINKIQLINNSNIHHSSNNMFFKDLDQMANIKQPNFNKFIKSRHIPIQRQKMYIPWSAPKAWKRLIKNRKWYNDDKLFIKLYNNITQKWYKNFFNNKHDYIQFKKLHVFLLYREDLDGNFIQKIPEKAEPILGKNDSCNVESMNRSINTVSDSETILKNKSIPNQNSITSTQSFLF